MTEDMDFNLCMDHIDAALKCVPGKCFDMMVAELKHLPDEFKPMVMAFIARKVFLSMERGVLEFLSPEYRSVMEILAERFNVDVSVVHVSSK